MLVATELEPGWRCTASPQTRTRSHPMTPSVWTPEETVTGKWSMFFSHSSSLILLFGIISRFFWPPSQLAYFSWWYFSSYSSHPWLEVLTTCSRSAVHLMFHQLPHDPQSSGAGWTPSDQFQPVSSSRSNMCFSQPSRLFFSLHDDPGACAERPTIAEPRSWRSHVAWSKGPRGPMMHLWEARALVLPTLGDPVIYHRNNLVSHTHTVWRCPRWMTVCTSACSCVAYLLEVRVRQESQRWRHEELLLKRKLSTPAQQTKLSVYKQQGNWDDFTGTGPLTVMGC